MEEAHKVSEQAALPPPPPQVSSSSHRTVTSTQDSRFERSDRSNLPYRNNRWDDEEDDYAESRSRFAGRQ